MVINNKKEAAVSGQWSNPGATLYDRLLEETNFKTLLSETYLIAVTDRISNSESNRTSFSASGVGYPHHVIRNGQLVIHEAGLRASYSRAQQQGIVSGAVEAHLKRHYREMGWYEESNISEEVEHQENVDKFLEHYGILGMRWGVRRDRGPDGRVRGRGKPTEDYLRAKELRTKGPISLTNAEMRVAIERMQLEQQYKNLSKADISAGQGMAQKVLGRVGNRVLDKAIEQSVKITMEALIKKK